MLYYIVKTAFGVTARLLYGVVCEGAENVPDKGPAIVCANHISWWDPVLVAYAIKRPIHFMAKKELFQNPIASHIFRRLHAFPVNRQKADPSAYRKSLEVLRSGEILGMFPEGTRQKGSQDLGEIHSGAALFAMRTGALVIPTAISGPYRIGGPVTVTFGKSIEIKSEGRRGDAKEGALAIKRAIETLRQGEKETQSVS